MSPSTALVNAEEQPDTSAGTATDADAGSDAATDGNAEVDTHALTARVARAVGAAFSRFTKKHQQQRGNTFGLSMSGLGGCRRRAAYQIAGTPPSDPAAQTSGENRAANLGTMIHTGLLPELAEVLGAREEISVTLTIEIAGEQLVIPGRTDLYWPHARGLLDLKTVGEHKLGQTVAAGAFPEHRVQVCGYAMAAELTGHPVDWIGWIYLDRATGEHYVIIEKFTDTHRDLVIDRCNELLNYTEAPDNAPRDEPGPGNRGANKVCNGCAWLRACWGETARPGVAGAQATKIEDFGGMEAVLVDYLTTRDSESAAKARKEFLRELIVGNPMGTYGRARWLLTKPSKTADKNACVQLVQAAGQTVPTKETERRLIVSWVIPDQTQDPDNDSDNNNDNNSDDPAADKPARADE